MEVGHADINAKDNVSDDTIIFEFLFPFKFNNFTFCAKLK